MEKFAERTGTFFRGWRFSGDFSRQRHSGCHGPPERVTDGVVFKRLWRIFQHQEVYGRENETLEEAGSGLGQHLRFVIYCGPTARCVSAALPVVVSPEGERPRDRGGVRVQIGRRRMGKGVENVSGCRLGRQACKKLLNRDQFCYWLRFCLSFLKRLFLEVNKQSAHFGHF
jgi:hypothetical protein